MMFQIGDTVVHPSYGAGTIVGIGKLRCLGSGKAYYSIELSDGSGTRVWVSVADAVERGVRPLTPVSELSRVWFVLCSGPEALSSDRDTRQELLHDKLRGGNVVQVAEVVRDMYWEDRRVRRLTVLDRELYDKGLALLTSEVAAVQGCDLQAAEASIADVLAASLLAKPAV